MEQAQGRLILLQRIDSNLTPAQLCPANGDTKNPLAIYHHNIFSEKSYIEILDRSLLDTLDLVVSTSTCILVYRPR